MPNYYYTTTGPSYTFGRAWTPAVKSLIIINICIFLLQIVFSKSTLFTPLALQVPEAITQLKLWQVFTYMFLHGGFWHLAFNMFALWMFGCDVEATIGTRQFYYYYFTIGIGAGICVALVGKLAGEHSVTLGASGAIFGILLAYGVLFAEKIITLLLFFILPIRMKAKTMVLLFGIFEFLAGVGNAFGNVSHLAHLSGLLIGYIFFLVFWPEKTPRFSIIENVKMWWYGRRVRKINPEEYVDEILEKISRDGIGSLSKHEREILNEISRQRRNN